MNWVAEVAAVSCGSSSPVVALGVNPSPMFGEDADPRAGPTPERPPFGVPAEPRWSVGVGGIAMPKLRKCVKILSGGKLRMEAPEGEEVWCERVST